MVLEERKIVQISFCMLEKSGVTVCVRDDVDEVDEVDETVEDGRGGRLMYAPRLIVKTGYVATSSGGGSIMKA